MYQGQKTALIPNSDKHQIEDEEDKGDDQKAKRMMNFWRQMRFLLWKCILVKKRQKIWLSLELFLPCVLFIVVALVRLKNFDKAIGDCHYDSKGMFSAGVLPLLHSFFCSISNDCHKSPTTGDEMHQMFSSDENWKSEIKRNESIIVDFLRTAALQMKNFGESEEKFKRMLDITSELIVYFAELDPSEGPGLARVEDLFDRSDRDDIYSILEGPVGNIILNKLMNGYIRIGIIDIYPIFDKKSKLLFCDENIFRKVFYFKPSKGMTTKEINKLCQGVSTAKSSFLDKTIENAKFPTASRSKIKKYFDEFVPYTAPAAEFFKKYGRLDEYQLKKQIFCGVSSSDVFTKIVSTDEVLVETHFSRISRLILEYVKSVEVGNGENETCTPVAPLIFENCTMDKRAVNSHILPLLTGKILITPENEATRKLVEMLNRPLRVLEYLRQFSLEYPPKAAEIQTSIYNSYLHNATMNFYAFADQTDDTDWPTETDVDLRFTITSLFRPFVNPYSFGSLTLKLAQSFNYYFQCMSFDRFSFVANEKEMVQNAMCLMSQRQFLSGIVFDMDPNATNFDDFTSYKIRFRSSYIDSTTVLHDTVKSPFSRDRPAEDLKYLTFGFSYLQGAIDSALLELKKKPNDPTFGVYVQQEPHPCTSKDEFNVTMFIPMFLLISFIFPSALLVKNIVYEKELRIKEQMRAMGLGDAVHFYSWALISLVLSFISVLIISLILKYCRILNNISLDMLIVILTLFLFSSIAMSLFFSTLFTNANIATASTCVLWFVFYMPFQLYMEQAKTPLVVKISLIFPPTAVGYLFELLGNFNTIERGGWSDLPDMINEGNGVQATLCIIMLFVDTLIFLFLAWYISAVAPGDYGVRQPFYFPFTMRYWRPHIDRSKIPGPDETLRSTSEDKKNDCFDSEPSGLKMTVSIEKMSKIYDNGTIALDNLTLKLYENQITGFLGHNGAGKTTTMSILCGLYAPSSGTAKIYSRDIRTDLRSVREVMGICPQHNVLFTYLTVAEQLRLFAALKGVEDKYLDEQVNEILASVSLKEKANVLASTLSGGMKRRLCIGIALIGGSKFVILDEPTAGVDVTMRKDIWKLLQRNKAGRTILLSTHHMDEADVLSDRIAILSQGKCITVGSPMFLKRRFGKSSSLTIVKQDYTIDYSLVTKEVINLGKPIGVEKEDENEEELVFSIPTKADSNELERFFTDLDLNLEKFKLGQYGISAPTLQNIFVSLASKKELVVPKASKKKTKSESISGETEISKTETTTEALSGTVKSLTSTSLENTEINFEEFEKPELLTGFALTLQHIWALLACRFSYSLRNKRVFLFQVIIPITLLFLCELYVIIQFPKRTDLKVADPPLPLYTGFFGNQTALYVNSWDKRSDSIVRSLLESPGAGARCVKSEKNVDYQKMLKDLFEVRDMDTGQYRKHIGVNKKFVQTKFECSSIKGKLEMEFSPVDSSSIPYNEKVDCRCTHLGSSCSTDNWNWAKTEVLQLNSTDRVYSLRGKNLSQFRIVNYKSATKNATTPVFIGGLSVGHHKELILKLKEVAVAENGWDNFYAILGDYFTTNVEPENLNEFSSNITIEDVVSMTFANLDTRENVKVWFNNKVWPALPIVSNILSNTLLRKNAHDADPDDIGILTINHPMNKTSSETISMRTTQFSKLLAMFRIVCLLLVLSMIPAGFTVYLVEDRVCEALHLQLVGGLKKIVYWSTSFIYDLAVYTLVITCIMVLFVSFSVAELTNTIPICSSVFGIIFIYGIAFILYAYVLQKRFTIPALSFVSIAIGCYFVGVVCTLTTLMIESMVEKDPTLETANVICSYIFLIVPQYCLAMAIFRQSLTFQIYKVAVNYLVNIDRGDMIHEVPIPHPLDSSVMGFYLICLCVHVFVAAGSLVFSQMDEFSFMRHKERERTNKMLSKEYVEDEDDDVVRERNRVSSMPEGVDSNALVVRQLAKAYTKDQLVVRGISFAVEYGECFGLLGLNGAGKTTTFSMLTTKIWPGHGSIEMGNTLINSHTSSGSQDFRNLGYCPQFDALNMKLTTKQNLKFFARIRGIIPSQIDTIVDRLLVALHLRPYSDTQTASLSGGNKRKLSVAVALVSQPSLVYLDEPSAGMDPGSQQFLWKVIARFCKSGKAVVLTSHSMEECEALCTRIAIMDRGRIRCLGGKQHLKNKFGKGVILTVKVSGRVSVIDMAETLRMKISGSKVKGIHCTTIFLLIPQGTSTIAQILRAVNELKKSYSFEDYTLSQSTLDNVFHSIAETRVATKEIPAESPPVIVLAR